MLIACGANVVLIGHGFHLFGELCRVKLPPCYLAKHLQLNTEYSFSLLLRTVEEMREKHVKMSRDVTIDGDTKSF